MRTSVVNIPRSLCENADYLVWAIGLKIALQIKQWPGVFETKTGPGIRIVMSPNDSEEKLQLK